MDFVPFPMRVIVILYLLINSTSHFAQLPPVLQWQHSYGGSLVDKAADIVLLSDGSILALATSWSNDGDITGNHSPPPRQVYSDIVVIKFNPQGNILWQKSYGGSLADEAKSIIATSDGGFAFVGTVISNDGDVESNHGEGDIWVVKSDVTGTIQWDKCFGGSGLDMASDIIEVNGGFMIVGLTSSLDGDVTGLHGNSSDMWLFRTNLSGNLTWQRAYGGSGGESLGVDVIKDSGDGNFIIASITSSTDGDITNQTSRIQDLWLVKISGSGAILWDKRHGGEFADKDGE